MLEEGHKLCGMVTHLTERGATENARPVERCNFCTARVHPVHPCSGRPASTEREVPLRHACVQLGYAGRPIRSPKSPAAWAARPACVEKVRTHPANVARVPLPQTIWTGSSEILKVGAKWRSMRLSGFGDNPAMPDESKQSETTDQAPKRILLVDDDPEIVDSMRYALEAKGYQILIARDGNQGLAMAEREDPDLVILDMMMPKRSGFLVLERLRRTRKVPMRVIMITANEGSRHKAYAEMLGVDDYIRKPFAMDRLLESVDRLLA